MALYGTSVILQGAQVHNCVRVFLHVCICLRVFVGREAVGSFSGASIAEADFHAGRTTAHKTRRQRYRL